MSGQVYTTLLEFHTQENFVKDSESQNKATSVLLKILQDHKFTLANSSVHGSGGKASFIFSFANTDGAQANGRGLSNGLLTLDIQEVVDTEPVFSSVVVEAIKEKVEKEFKSSRSVCLPAIRRGGEYTCYVPTEENLLIEYDYIKCVYHASSEYQDIKIMASKQYGNMLLLNDDPNLAESDLAYTHAITGYQHEDYEGKTVLILGGGDGGILHELRKKNPKMITMVDIDGLVVEAAAKYLRGICGDSLDQLTGQNYEVLIADCVPILHKYKADGHLFDFVINDLTAIPCTTEAVGEHWEFLRLILDLSMAVLSPTGRYYTQGNSANMTKALAMYEAQLDKLETPVEFTKEVVCVPSYHEMWMFYKIWKKLGRNSVNGSS